MTTINIYPEQVLNPINRKILGHFVEQFPGNIPGGIFMPGNQLSDEMGFRKDVLEALREVNVSQIRWAGNFSSHYHWIDGVGPKENRPKKINFAWDATEDNLFGTAEFVAFCKKVGSEPVIGVNMGSGTAEEAMNWVEYCNSIENTCYANLRRSNGYENPFNVKYWCLGNEMYAQWQFGHLDAEEYAKKAVHFAYAMKRADPNIKLTAVGLETDPDWNYKVVEKLSILQVPYAPNAGEYIDYLSAHYYPIGNDSAYTNSDYEMRMTLGEFFHERTVLMRNAIENATDDMKSHIKVVWDEWNPVGQRDGTEFTLEMAVWTALIMNSFVRYSKYVEMANYTFFVNGNGGPICVTEDGILKQAEYYVFELFGKLLGSYLVGNYHDAKTVCLDMPVDGRWPRWDREKSKKRDISLLDINVTKDEDGKLKVFVINISPDEDFYTEINIKESGTDYTKAILYTIWNKDYRAKNSQEKPKEICINEQQLECKENTIKVKFLHHSINAIQIS